MMVKEKEDRLIVMVFGVVLSYLTYTYVLKQLEWIYADFNGHTYVYLPLFSKENWIEGWMTVPYCMWHLTTMFFNRILFIPIESAAAYSACVYTLLAYFVMYWMIRRITEAAGSVEGSARAAFIAFGMCVLQCFYFHWLGHTIKLVLFTQMQIHPTLTSKLVLLDSLHRPLLLQVQ